MRKSDRVIDLWTNVLSHVSNLGHEKWTILEQVFIAALDMADDRLACDCLELLRAKFKKSSRVKRLFGMYLERNGRFDDAHTVYSQLLADDPTNTFVRKRMISILKAQRKNVEAIEELRQYLKIFMSDFEAWNELADMYLAEGDYKHAAFCMEEMLLSNPHNHLYCQRYAEIKYTEGGTDNLEQARAYFSQACRLCPTNLRSLYGLLLTCSALDHQTHRSGKSSLLSLKDRDESRQIEAKAINASGPDLYCTLQPTCSTAIPISGPELNYRLFKWARQQIQLIYRNSLVEHVPHLLSLKPPNESKSPGHSTCPTEDKVLCRANSCSTPSTSTACPLEKQVSEQSVVVNHRVEGTSFDE
ncbi:ER membrane protein complex subunit 2-A [Paragonimus heterotremus]|uniref:ER membrane protein complex subunit 2 n=1 Tax=Paragonimus heterotremus TaxID=100268 RepID=A0A8J4WFQ9_9TREM|nr:ER membrane protein complex subunit 2-A [Paragonimus heterotremus]